MTAQTFKFIDYLGSIKTAGVVTISGLSGNIPATCSMANGCFECKATPIRPFTGDYYIELTPLYNPSCTTFNGQISLTVQVKGANAVSANIRPPYTHGGTCLMLDLAVFPPQLPTRRYGDPVTVVTATLTLSTQLSTCNLFIANAASLNKPIQDTHYLRMVGISPMNGYQMYLINLLFQSPANIDFSAHDLSPAVAPPPYPTFVMAEVFAPSSNGIGVTYTNLSPSTLALSTKVTMTEFSHAFFVETSYATKQVDFTYPFGFKSGRLPQYTHATELPFPRLQPAFSAWITIQNEKSVEFPINTNPVVQDILPPYLESLEIIPNPTDPYNFIYRVVAGDKGSGIYSITITEEGDVMNLRTVILKEADVKVGNATYGTFERTISLVGIHHSANLVVTLCDRVGLKVTHRSGDYIPIYLTKLTNFPQQVTWGLRNITSISFATITVDTTVFSPTNTMYLTLSNPDKRIKPRIRMQFFAVTELNTQFEFVGSYVDANARYEIQYSIPRFLTNDVNFFLYADDIIPGASIFSIYSTIFAGYGAILSVDMMSPVISTAVPFPSKSSSFENSGGSIGWNLTISCPTSVGQRCLLPVWGYVIVKGEFEPMTRNFTIPVTPGINMFSFDFPITQNCTSQVFRIIDVLLTDGVHRSQSNKPGLIDPAIYMLTNGPSTNSILCNPPIDLQPPTLLSFTLNATSIDVSKGSRTGDSDRSILVKFSTTDPSGIKPEALPTIYVSSLFGEKLSIVAKLDACVLKVCQYTSIIQFPFGWGSSDFYVSLYGIVDSFDNFIGYTTSDLKAFGSQSVISRKFDL
eukprot:gene14232-16794_t